MLTLAGHPMRACCLISGNPLTACKLLAAGGARVGLYLPTKILVFETEAGEVHVAYDRFSPIMAALGDAALSAVAGRRSRPDLLRPARLPVHSSESAIAQAGGYR